MEVGALTVSIVAIFITLAVSGFAIWFQWRMFGESTRQLGEAQKVLAKLEGVSLQLRETQEKQYSSLLSAVVGLVKKQGGEAAEEAAALLEERVEGLESSSADYEEKIKEAIEAFRREMAERATSITIPSTFPSSPLDLGTTLQHKLTAIDLESPSFSIDPEGRVRYQVREVEVPSDDEGDEPES